MRVVLTGASGQLGAYVLSELLAGGHEVRAWSGSATGSRGGVPLEPVELTDPAAIDRALAEADPEAIVHTAAISAADAVLRDRERARAINVAATERLAAWCTRHGRRLVYTSTDLVFNGKRSWYREDDVAEPPQAYGRSKLDSEPAVLATPRGLVARMSVMFGPSRSGRESYFDRTIAALRRGESQTFFADEYRTALDLATAARVLVALTETEPTGLLHVGGRERVSRYDLIRRAVAALGLDPALVRGNRQADVVTPEPRPADVSLDTSRLAALLPKLHRPSIEEAAVAFEHR